MRYDVMIIGGGPGGYSAANKAGKNGLKTILFEKDQIGGTCLNRGCIPMKALIQSARVYRDAKQGELFGVMAENLSIDYGTVKERRDFVVSSLRGGIEKSLKANRQGQDFLQRRDLRGRSHHHRSRLHSGDPAD